MSREAALPVDSISHPYTSFLETCAGSVGCEPVFKEPNLRMRGVS